MDYTSKMKNQNISHIQLVQLTKGRYEVKSFGLNEW